MFDDDNDPREQPSENASDPAVRAKEKTDEFRMHAELAAVLEGGRKFEADFLPGLDPEIARDVQKTIGKLAKSRSPEAPLLPEPSIADAARLLDLPQTANLSSNDYHVYRRPGEVMIVRFLAGDQVETFYERLQAHFDAAMNQYRQEERQSHGWKQDKATMAYLDALDVLEIKMSDRYARPLIRKHNIYVLSDQSADEIDILYVSDYLMGLDAAQLVGSASAPPEEPTERDRAWFYKLYSLRGMKDGQERMCFFIYLQKSDDAF
jgi:hypothetical protein